MRINDKFFAANKRVRQGIAIISTIVISGAFTLWGIYVIGEYGIALFILTPFLMGFSSAIIYGYKNNITLKAALITGLVSLGLFAFCLVLFAIEGLICIAMVAPIAIPLTLVGGIAGYSVVKKLSNQASTMMLVIMLGIPTVAFIEKENEPELTAVTTSIEINADIYTVWKNVIEFPQLAEPTEFIFQTGIAYPINATIDGDGIGAIRYCNFTTGSFVEPITVWNEPNLLKFTVEEQPAPMKEISFWDIDAPHLHDYFVSKEGQFKLTALPNGKTMLEGTTWYYHNIKPAIYWQIWSNHIIHKIHNRVLTHIKTNSEKVVN